MTDTEKASAPEAPVSKKIVGECESTRRYFFVSRVYQAGRRASPYRSLTSPLFVRREQLRK